MSTSHPFKADEKHLNALLQGAKRYARKTDVYSLRVATFHIVEYYDVVMTEAAAKLNVDLRKISVGEKARTITNLTPGVEPMQWLDKWPILRNSLAHDVMYRPSLDDLEMFIVRAEETRSQLLERVADEARQQANMSKLAVRILHAGQMLAAAIPSHYFEEDEKPRMEELAQRAITISRTKGALKKPSMDMVDLLVEIHSILAVLNHVRTLEDEAQAADAMADAYASRYENYD